MTIQDIALSPTDTRREWRCSCNGHEFILIVARGQGFTDRVFAFRRSGNRGHNRWRKLDSFIIDNILPNWELIA